MAPQQVHVHAYRTMNLQLSCGPQTGVGVNVCGVAPPTTICGSIKRWRDCRRLVWLWSLIRRPRSKLDPLKDEHCRIGERGSCWWEEARSEVRAVWSQPLTELVATFVYVLAQASTSLCRSVGLCRIQWGRNESNQSECACVLSVAY